MGKPKRKSKLFPSILLDDEEILWTDQPVASRLFTSHDLVLIPFSLFWCGFVAFWMVGASRGGPFCLFGLPHALVGVYLLVGRFIYKYLKKHGTYYAVSNRRILIWSGLLYKHLNSLYVEQIPGLNVSVGFGDIGTVTFGLPPSRSWWNRNNSVYWPNTGMDLFGGDAPGFYDIRDPERVYTLINQVRDWRAGLHESDNRPQTLPR